MKIVALYKLFDGEEWLEASLSSVYQHVDAIVIVHTDIDWLGNRGGTCRSVVAAWRQQYDQQHKLTELFFDTRDQAAQYKYGLSWISKHLAGCVTLIVDADEVWDNENLIRAKEYVHDHDHINAFKCSMHTYVRSPLYRVVPPESCKPLVFIRNPLSFAGVRGNRTANGILMPDVFFHHFTQVRMDERSVLLKVKRSEAGDGHTAEHVDRWFRDKFLKLPHATNFHPSRHYEWSWKTCEVITFGQLPACVRDTAIVKKYL